MHTVGRTVKDQLPLDIQKSQILIPHIFQQMHCRIAGLDSILQYQVALTSVFCPAPGMDPLQ